MARIGLTPGYQAHDSLAVPGRLTATIRERLAEQRHIDEHTQRLLLPLLKTARTEWAAA